MFSLLASSGLEKEKQIKVAMLFDKELQEKIKKINAQTLDTTENKKNSFIM